MQNKKILLKSFNPPVASYCKWKNHLGLHGHTNISPHADMLTFLVLIHAELICTVGPLPLFPMPGRSLFTD